MLEQSKLNSPVYYTREMHDEHGRSKLANKTVTLSSVHFGPKLHVVIHRNQLTPQYMVVCDQTPQPNGFIYDAQGQPVKQVVSSNHKGDRLFPYWYGEAEYDGARTPYLIQNAPPVTSQLTPDLNHFDLPPVLRGFGYAGTFSYDSYLIKLIGDCPATFTDKYKRPLNYASLMKKQLYFPASLDKIATTFKEVAAVPNSHFPAVVLLNPPGKPIRFATLDLEPTYTPDDLALAESFAAYYREDTPRGGKHYLLKADAASDVFKYRLTPNLEAQTRAQITFYGLNSKQLEADPAVSDFSSYHAVGTRDRLLINPKMPDGVSQQVDECRSLIKRLGTTGAEQARRIYLTDTDPSHADFMALLTLYRTDLMPIVSSLPTANLPWILAGYGASVIPGRLKHNTMRSSVPYLVYLANKIIYQGDKIYHA